MIAISYNNYFNEECGKLVVAKNHEIILERLLQKFGEDYFYLIKEEDLETTRLPKEIIKLIQEVV